tara:strand:- start:506 stop:898 length:393 start_codon:yes stop_codon:yes gene_type:complete
VKKDELISYLNGNTKGRKAGRKEFRTNDIFISSSSNTENFRLTSFGANIMKKHFKEYIIKNVPIADTDCGVPTTGISGKMILILDRYLKTPYILTNKRLRLYEESVAAQILLMGIQDWVEQKSKISEKSQ